MLSPVKRTHVVTDFTVLHCVESEDYSRASFAQHTMVGRQVVMDLQKLNKLGSQLSKHNSITLQSSTRWSLGGWKGKYAKKKKAFGSIRCIQVTTALGIASAVSVVYFHYIVLLTISLSLFFFFFSPLSFNFLLYSLGPLPLPAPRPHSISPPPPPTDGQIKPLASYVCSPPASRQLHTILHTIYTTHNSSIYNSMH